jgi:hypothetical protein
VKDLNIISLHTSERFNHILNLINLHKNGTVSDSMKASGLNYKINFGVSIVDLRKIAKTYYADNTLSKLLWEKGWRETFILATLIADPRTLDKASVDKWTNEIPTTEISEQLGNNLIANITSSVILKELLYSPDNLKRITAYKALSKQFLMRNFNNKDIFIESLDDDLTKTVKYRRDLAVSLGQTISFLIRYNNNLINYLLKKITYFHKISVDFELTHQIVKTEINFFCEGNNSE